MSSDPTELVSKKIVFDLLVCSVHCALDSPGLKCVFGLTNHIEYDEKYRSKRFTIEV